MKRLVFILFLVGSLGHAQIIDSFTPFASASGNDADAQAFIDAVGTLTAGEETAINDFVVGLKADGLWSGLKIYYPFVGGTAAEHKWNLKDPRDLDAAFRLTFSGTWTHDSEGITGDASTAYVDTHFVPSTEVTATSYMHTVYYKDDLSQGSGWGVKVGGNFLTLYPEFGSTTYSYMYDDANNVNGSAGNTMAMYVAVQNGGTSHKLFKDGSQVFSTNTGDNTAGVANLNLSMYLGAVNRDGTAGEYSSRTISGWGVGTHYTDSEVSDFYDRVQTLQTDLSRQN